MYETRMVRVGNLTLGGHNPVWVQSMTNTDTRDAQATLGQIRALAKAGCDFVRVSVYDEDCARAVRTLVDGSPVPLVADIHFNHRLAIAAAENGIHKLRINPGNIGGEAHVRELAAAAKAHHIPIRIGVNTGSIEKDILAKYGQPCAEGLVESALNHARMLEKVGFEDIVLSMKASDVRLTIAAYELAAKRCDYPLHVGVTEAGLPGQGTIKSAIGIGALLAEGDSRQPDGRPRAGSQGSVGHPARAEPADAWRAAGVLPDVRADVHRRGGHCRARGEGAFGHSSAAEGGGDGLRGERPRRSARSGHWHGGRQARRRTVRQGAGADGGRGESG